MLPKKRRQGVDRAVVPGMVPPSARAGTPKQDEDQMTDNAVSAQLTARINDILSEASQRDRLTALVCAFSVEISMIELKGGRTREEVADKLLELVKRAVINLEDVN